MAWSGAITLRDSSSSGTTGGQTFTSGSFTPTANSTLFVWANSQNDGHTTAPDIAISNTGGLTFTRVAQTAAAAFDVYNDYQGRGALFSAPVGGSPSAMTVTIDPHTGTQLSTSISLVAFDVTQAELVQAIAVKAETDAYGDAESHTTTALGSAATTGNLSVLCVGVGGDVAGAAATPSGWTALASQSQIYTHAAVFYRTDFAGTSVTISDLGEDVGHSFTALFEIRSPSGVTGTAAQNGLFPTQSASGTYTPATINGTAAQNGLLPTQSASGTAVPPAITGTAAQTTPLATQSAIQASTRFVTAVSSDGRYMVDQFGDPILIRGAFAWSAVADWSTSDDDTYFDHLAARGVNVVLMEAIAVDGDGGGHNSNGATYDGIAPFVGGDITNFNSSYWNRVDSFISAAEARGITCLVYFMDGWNTDPGKIFDGVSEADAEDYGTTLATRWLSRPNIMWGSGGDYSVSGPADDIIDAALTGIRAAGDTRPFGIQLDFYKSLSTDSTFWESRVTVNFVYTYYPQYKGISDGYNRSPGARDPRPALWIEGRYEGEGGGPGEPSQTDETIRRQSLWALTSGSPGDFYGNSDWAFPSGWQGRMDSTVQQQLQKVRAWFAGLAWHTLIPDDATGQSAVITAGRGTKITTDSQTWPLQNDWVTASRNATKTLLVAYVPSNSGNTARTLTLDPAQIPAVNRVALWVDPTDATSTQTATITSNQVTTPGTHGDGTRDWLLLITGDAYTGTASQSALLPTQQASGTATPPAITGTAAQVTLLPTQAASGTITFTGAATQTTPVVAQAASGTYTPATITGTAAQTVALVTQSADGTVTLPGSTGTAAQSTPLPTQTASGTITFTGTASQTAPLVTQAASGDVTNPGVAGSANDVTPLVTQAASGTWTPPSSTGTAAQTALLPTQAASGTAVPPVITGTATQTTPAVTQAASGSAVPPGEIQGTAAQTTPLVSQAASGTAVPPVISGTATQATPLPTQTASGTVVVVITGTAAQVTPAVTQVATQVVDYHITAGRPILGPNIRSGRTR